METQLVSCKAILFAVEPGKPLLRPGYFLQSGTQGPVLASGAAEASTIGPDITTRTAQRLQPLSCINEARG